MYRSKLGVVTSFLTILVAAVACTGSNSGIPGPIQSNPNDGLARESPPASDGSGSSQDTPSNGAPTNSATSASEPVATNVLVLIGFPAAEGPENHDGHFRLFDSESQIGFKNTGDSPIHIASAEVINATGAAFYLKSDSCSGRTLAEEQVCVIWVKLDPPTPPGRSVPYSGQLILRMPAQNAYQILPLSADASVPAATSSGPSSSSTPSNPAQKATTTPTLPSTTAAP
jgi:hypothetical protein